MSYKRVLTIQDISCVGQCSMTVALPVLSVCGCETCILPSAVLSTHTGGFGTPVVLHLSSGIRAMLRHWEQNNIHFDVIYTGYLGSIAAIDEVNYVMDHLLAPGGIVIVDPAMADHGKLYAGLEEAYASAMTQLCRRADVILPNLTEGFMLAALPYRETYDESCIRQLLEHFGNSVVLTGVGFREGETGVAVRTGDTVSFLHHKKFSRSYHGTGDLFAACFTGAIAQGKPIASAARIAAEFTLRCMEITQAKPAHWYGIKFEPVLSELPAMLRDESLPSES